jgi:hypothetical protein
MDETMNVTSIRKSLRASEWPSESKNEIALNDSQIHHLEATVPCVKMASSTGNTVLYFPDAGAKLITMLTNGISLHSEYRGTLLKGAKDIPCHEDGTSRYVADGGGTMPVVYKEAAHAEAAKEHFQKILWLKRKPYRIRVEGYESVHSKGWPKDKRMGHDKISLSVLDGDFKSVYLSVETLNLRGGGETQDLAEAVKRGEYNGSETTRKFEDRVRQQFSDRMARIHRRLDFENFVRYDPKESVKKDIDNHNQQVNAYYAFLKMASRLRRHMKANPGWYKKAKMPGDVHKNSELFRYTEELKESDRARRESDPDLDRAVIRLDR